MWNPKLIGGAVVGLAALGAHEGRAITPENHFVHTNLIASPSGPPASFEDKNLVNSWGLITLDDGDFWTTNNWTSTATRYQSDGSPRLEGTEPVVVAVPGGPTGLVLNTTPGFLIQSQARVAPSSLIFVTERGMILGYNPAVEPTRSLVAVDFSGFHSVFKGAALFPGPLGSRLYAADFANGVVQTFDESFELVGDFENDPDQLSGFAPFNVATIDNSIFVAFARQEPGATDDVAGVDLGLGFIDQFDADGKLLRRFATGGELNAPWAMVRAPFDFGPFVGALLVGNSGDGNINAFDFVTGELLGKVKHRASVDPVIIDGLRGLDFGKTRALRQSLFFAAGPGGEQGLVGTVRPFGG